jgi:hypothetical protein
MDLSRIWIPFSTLPRHFRPAAALSSSIGFHDLLTLLHVSEGRPYGTFPETQRARCLRRVRFCERGSAGSVLRFSGFGCKTNNRRGVWGGFEFRNTGAAMSPPVFCCPVLRFQLRLQKGQTKPPAPSPRSPDCSSAPAPASARIRRCSNPCGAHSPPPGRARSCRRQNIGFADG